jgi:hypothetical protein
MVMRVAMIMGMLPMSGFAVLVVMLRMDMAWYGMIWHGLICYNVSNSL